MPRHGIDHSKAKTAARSGESNVRFDDGECDFLADASEALRMPAEDHPARYHPLTTRYQRAQASAGPVARAPRDVAGSVAEAVAKLDLSALQCTEAGRMTHALWRYVVGQQVVDGSEGGVSRRVRAERSRDGAGHVGGEAEVPGAVGDEDRAAWSTPQRFLDSQSDSSSESPSFVSVPRKAYSRAAAASLRAEFEDFEEVLVPVQGEDILECTGHNSAGPSLPSLLQPGRLHSAEVILRSASSLDDFLADPTLLYRRNDERREPESLRDAAEATDILKGEAKTEAAEMEMEQEADVKILQFLGQSRPVLAVSEGVQEPESRLQARRRRRAEIEKEWKARPESRSVRK
ncbi:hypothetical protein B0A49_05047 [Cryomyces minteri]|uniref:Uncharacterized protein n=1 Tax=Cryomyces minteri TaxID=331657 RepID=A0A4U0WWA0_9PEZI|nr:hypothetical protein B0A49_05047 [Cryomyces minteri]